MSGTEEFTWGIKISQAALLHSMVAPCSSQGRRMGGPWPSSDSPRTLFFCGGWLAASKQTPKVYPQKAIILLLSQRTINNPFFFYQILPTSAPPHHDHHHCHVTLQLDRFASVKVSVTWGAVRGLHQGITIKTHPSGRNIIAMFVNCRITIFHWITIVGL